MPQGLKSTTSLHRVARHRRKLASVGAKRVEVIVPARDAALVRDIADRLRQGGEPARKVRDSLRPLVSPRPARSGRDLLAFFRASPLVGLDLEFPRDISPGRDVTL